MLALVLFGSLAFDAQRSIGNRLESAHADWLVALLAGAIVALFDAFEGIVNLVEDLLLA